MIKNESTEVKLPDYLYDFELLKQTRLLQISLEQKINIRGFLRLNQKK